MLKSEAKLFVHNKTFFQPLDLLLAHISLLVQTNVFCLLENNRDKVGVFILLEA